MKFKTTLAAILLLACLSHAARAQEDTFTPFFDARVIGVLDGNTLSVRNETTGQQSYVRLRGTDAPELRQPYGAESRKHLASLVEGKTARVEFRFTDRAGRVLGRVLVEGDDINLAQLDAGLAWFYTDLANELENDQRATYRKAEEDARAARRGLWKDAAPTPPWKYRAANNLGEDPRDIPPPATPAPAKPVFGDRRAKVYYLPSCAGYARVPARTRVRFKTAEEATAAGYKPARGCEP